MEDRRNVGENSCNSGDGTDQTGPILDVYDDDDDDDDKICIVMTTRNATEKSTVTGSVFIIHFRTIICVLIVFLL